MDTQVMDMDGCKALIGKGKLFKVVSSNPLQITEHMNKNGSVSFKNKFQLNI